MSTLGTIHKATTATFPPTFLYTRLPWYYLCSSSWFLHITLGVYIWTTHGAILCSSIQCVVLSCITYCPIDIALEGRVFWVLEGICQLNLETVAENGNFFHWALLFSSTLHLVLIYSHISFKFVCKMFVLGVAFFVHLPCFIAYIWCDSHTLTHSERLSISVEPQQKVVNASDRAELTCMASSYPPPTIVWTREVSTELQLQAGVIEDKQGSLPIPTFLATLCYCIYCLETLCFWKVSTQ